MSKVKETTGKPAPTAKATGIRSETVGAFSSQKDSPATMSFGYHRPKSSPASASSTGKGPADLPAQDSPEFAALVDAAIEADLQKHKKKH
ncbi:MAG TPA: hypothetical protein VM240_05520 [Verrucomicrobiae bacterium]|nr:hypothetical protein [Verrucomicrobiae bacterium]